ncbi:MAG: N-acetyltransferase [Thermodesulfobacteriota bacterium]|nr:N-acetyltransferase [Thermodesulfobacteriota bacterium]
MIRKAATSDVVKIKTLIDPFVKQGLILPRSLNSLYTFLRDFCVMCTLPGQTDIIGCCALSLSWEDLGEIRTLAIRDQHQGKTNGTSLVKACMSEAKELGLKRLFTLTYIPFFFKRMGFSEIDKSELPQKIWADCINCPYFPDCKEVALIYHL